MGGEEREDAGGERALLVPFLINGTLPPEDRVRMEAALPSDATLRTEVEAARGLATLVRVGGGVFAAEIARRPGRLGSLAERMAPRTGRRSGTIWKAALAAGLATAVVLAGFAGWETIAGQGYAVLSGPTRPPSPATVVARPAPGALWADVEALLSGLGVTIVGGPRDGALDLALPPDLSRDEALRRLQASPLIAFAGPAT